MALRFSIFISPKTIHPSLPPQSEPASGSMAPSLWTHRNPLPLLRHGQRLPWCEGRGCSSVVLKNFVCWWVPPSLSGIVWQFQILMIMTMFDWKRHSISLMFQFSQLMTPLLFWTSFWEAVRGSCPTEVLTPRSCQGSWSGRSSHPRRCQAVVFDWSYHRPRSCQKEEEEKKLSVSGKPLTTSRGGMPHVTQGGMTRQEGFRKTLVPWPHLLSRIVPCGVWPLNPLTEA